MQDYDLSLAGDPASTEFARGHMLEAPGSQSDHSGWNDANLAGSDAHSRRRRPAKAARREDPAEKVLRSFNTWAFKREQPSDPHLMQQVISHAITQGEPLNFTLYWGKGPRCNLAEPDFQCLDFLGLFVARVARAHAPGAALKLIFTDTHARLNGHSRASMQKYFAAMEAAANARRFETCWLTDLTKTAGVAAGDDHGDELAQHAMVSRLIPSARKWYRGLGGPEQGALIYYRMNLVERRAVELVFPRCIFLTFNGSELRGLFPEHLPIFYMYSLRRGISVKPWFLPPDAMPCAGPPCTCTPVT